MPIIISWNKVIYKSYQSTDQLTAFELGKSSILTANNFDLNREQELLFEIRISSNPALYEC